MTLTRDEKRARLRAQRARRARLAWRIPRVPGRPQDGVPCSVCRLVRVPRAQVTDRRRAVCAECRAVAARLRAIFAESPELERVRRAVFRVFA